MRRPFLFLVLLALALGACSPTSSDGPSTSESERTTSTAESSATTAEGAVSTTEDSVTAPPTTVSDRPVAPDFTLALGEGGSYTLSEGEKPVYLVFWAEW